MLSPGHSHHSPEVMRTTIREWVAKIYSGQRRQPSCMLIKYVSDFYTDAARTHPHREGHAITLGYDDADVFTVYDYREVEYAYNVHAQLLRMIRDAVREHHHAPAISTRVVSLKGRLEYDGRFMTCMAASFRACICLALGLPMHDEDFATNSANLQHHVFSMLRWAQTGEPLLLPDAGGAGKARYTALVSPEMAEPVFEICSASCYLLLAPSAVPPSYGEMAPRELIRLAAADQRSRRVRYSLRTGEFADT